MSSSCLMQPLTCECVLGPRSAGEGRQDLRQTRKRCCGCDAASGRRRRSHQRYAESPHMATAVRADLPNMATAVLANLPRMATVRRQRHFCTGIIHHARNAQGHEASLRSSPRQTSDQSLCCGSGDMLVRHAELEGVWTRGAWVDASHPSPEATLKLVRRVRGEGASECPTQQAGA